MPVLSVTMGEIPKEQKKELIVGLTKTAVDITGIPAQFFVVTINELPDINLGVGGRTVEEIKQDHQ